MRRLLTGLLVLLATPAAAQTTTTRTDVLLASTRATVGTSTPTTGTVLTLSSSATGISGVQFSGSAQDLTWATGETLQIGEWNGTTFAERMRIATGGNVAIGTATTSYLLTVAGTFNATGATTLGSTLGVTGLVTASSGVKFADTTVSGDQTLTVTDSDMYWRGNAFAVQKAAAGAAPGDPGYYILQDSTVKGWMTWDDDGTDKLNIGAGGTATIALLDHTSVTGDVKPHQNYAGNLGLLTTKWLTVHAAELWVQTLVAADVLSTVGGRILVLPTTQLSADLGDGAGDTTITVKHNNLASGDRIYLEANAKVEFMAVTSGAGGSAGAYTYSVTRDLDSSGRNLWYAGDAVANTGADGDGWIDLYSVRGVASGGYGPSIVGNERLSATYNDWAARWAIGNLNGLYGYSADTYGAAFGDPAANNLVIDATNGIRIRTGTTVLGQWSGSTVTLGQPLTSNNTGQIQIDSDSIDLRWRDNAGNTSSAAYLQKGAGDAAVFYVAGDGIFNGDIRVDGGDISDLSGNLTITVSDTSGTLIINPHGSGSVRPYSDGGTPLGTASYRWSNIHLSLPDGGTTFGYTVVGNPSASTSLAYYIRTEETITISGCAMTFRHGLLISKSGCS